jgi:hypothetical protein
MPPVEGPTMRAAGLVSLLFLVWAAGAGGQDPKAKNDRDPWNGFGVGSWVIRVENSTADGQTTTRREKQSRVATNRPGGIELKMHEEGNKPGVFDGKESTAWHVPGLDPALDPKAKLLSTTKQDLMIQGKTFACQVKKYELSRDGEKAVLTFWHGTDVKIPYREAAVEPRSVAMRPDVLRLEVEYTGKDRSMKAVSRVVSLREEREVGGRTVVCVREEWELETAEGDRKGKAKVEVLLSNDVPGREVEMTAEGEIGGSRVKRQTRVEAFHAVRER